MMTKPSMPLMLGVFAAFAVQGCRCDRPGGGASRGEVRIFYASPDGGQLSGDDATYDFGSVSMGKTVTQKLTVQNTGRGTVTLQTFSKVSGDPAKVGTFVDEASPVFTVAFTEAVDVRSGETVDFDIDFTPPVSETELEVRHESVLVMTSGNTEEGRENATITLLGKGISGECDLPATIDFGAVARGDTFSQDVDFTNARPIETTAFIGEIVSPQGTGLFTLSPDSPKGEFTVVGERTRTATLVFAPTEARDYFASVRMRRAEGCPEKVVRLIGTGVDTVLTWSPATLDFGYAPPGTTVPGEIVFSNQAIRDVQLMTMTAVDTGSTSPSNLFKVTETDQADLTKLLVPKAVRGVDGVLVPGTAKVKLTFKPTVLGPRTAQLRASTDLRNQGMVAVPLRGVGGGPDIDAKPSPLNFGRIAYFAQAVPAVSATRTLRVQNVGTRPTSPDPRANLKLGKPDGAGGYAGPYWEITAGAGSSMDEICVGRFDTNTNACLGDLPTSGAGRYDPAIGLEATAGLNTLDIPVRITPNGLGMKQFEIKIFSNDPDEVETVVTVTANSIVAPPCDITITPTSLAFGIVSPPSIKDLGFQIRNNKTMTGDFCLITGLQLESETGTPTGMPAVFSLPGGDIAELELQPGETKQIVARAWPQGQLPATPASVVGGVRFNAADPAFPNRRVNLTATIANSCLTISPSSLDFGTVQKDCSSPDRTFQIYNTCSTAVVINSTAMAAAAGEPAGGPNCMGASPCPEFFVVNGIAAGTRITPGATTPVTFALKYRPINYGPDTGSFVINVTQAGQALDYVVTLQGNGDTMGLNTDTFRQDSKPKADILLVIDDSCSMSDKQMELGQNLASFIQYATASQVDFQMGVTTTDMDSSVRGRLRTVPSSAPAIKILRPTTPNLSQNFASLVNVGINGSATESCLDPAVAALTAPLITDPAANLGLLRPDAVLAVVCVTDAEDQSPQAPTFYVNQLMNVKGAQRPGAFTYNVVGPFLGTSPSGSCGYDDSAPDPAKHLFAVQQTNGVKEEICTPNWSAALENIGKSAFGFRTNFFLNARPDLMASPIEVKIDGVTRPANDPVLMSKVWEYDATNNSVNFEPLYVPEPGQTLTITYQVACIP